MNAVPEIVRTGDIPEAEAEVQDALIARLSKAKSKPKQRERGKQKSKKEPTRSGLVPLVPQTPRSANLPGMPGNRANPGGKSTTWREAQKYAEVHVFECLDFLMAVVRDPLTKTSDRITASGMLLERGLGKAVELAKLEIENKTASESTENNVLVLPNGQKVIF